MPWYSNFSYSNFSYSNFSHSEFSSFLLRWAAESGLVLIAASAAVLLLRQPATRLRVIQWSFVACLLLAGVHRLDVGPRWSLSFPDRSRIRENSGAQPTPDFSRSRLRTAPTTEGDNAPSRIRENSGRDAQPAPDFSRSRLRTNRPLDPRQIVVAGYLAGVAIMAVWWLAGWVAVRRLLRRSRPADERCHAILREIAGRRAARVRLVECPTAAQPLVSGWWRPVIVVPTGLASGDTLALRCALAHEWSHVARGDIAWWSLAGVVRVVCFYQPLVWWLRGRMRLAQDCLADAEAAAQAASAEDYAELLTRWATSRLPLLTRVSTASLGILGRKSDLYRRIVMLVQHRIDRRCPRRWEMAIAISAVALLVSAATYGGAEDPPGRRAAKTPKPKDVIEPREPAPPAARSAEQVGLDRLVDGVLTRARAIHSGRFQFKRTVDRAARGLFDDAREADFRISLSGDDWAVSQTVVIDNHRRSDDIICREGRLLMLRCARSPQERAGLSIGNPNSVPRSEYLAAIRAGTLPSEAVARFIDEHRHEARLSAGEDAKKIGGTTRMEWKVAAADAARVFGDTSDLLAGGGLLRIDVAEEHGYVLPLVEYVDRFGGVEARYRAEHFADAAPGVIFPTKYRVSQNAEIHYDFHGIELVNKPMPDEDFELNHIPAGTHVTDVRPRRRPDGKLLGRGNPGPLQDFTLGAVYGLPKEMLAAMDEGVLSDEEAKKLTEAEANPPAAAEPQPVEQPAEPPRAGPPAAGVAKNDLRYAGRRFGDWRRKLLNDLDPSTCIEAMSPMAAFGKMGYAEEAVAALAEVLRSERATEGTIAPEAVNALVQIGAPAVPVLIEGLADPRPGVRGACANAVGALGEAGRATGPALLKLLEDEDASVRQYAAQALVAVGDDDVLRSALERLAKGDRAGVLAPFLQALSRRPPEGDWWVGPCLRLADDEDRHVRIAVGAMLANHGPAEKRVIRAVEELLDDDDGDVVLSSLVALSQGDNVPLIVAVLSDVIKSADLWELFRVNGTQLSLAIARLGRAPRHAAASVPLLAAIAEGHVPSFNEEPRWAMDALGKLGPAAKGAIPVLERLIARVDIPAEAPEKKHARRALQKIRAEDAPGEE